MSTPRVIVEQVVMVDDKLQRTIESRIDRYILVQMQPNRWFLTLSDKHSFETVVEWLLVWERRP